VAATHRLGREADVLVAGPGPGINPGSQPRVRLFTLDGQLLDDVLVDDPNYRGGVFVGG
jgi:hypothetical protein